MVSFKSMLGVAAAAALTLPTVASAEQTVRPSTSIVSAQGVQSGTRTGAARKGASAAGRGTSALVLAGLAAGLMGLGIAAIASNGHSKPVSPQ